MAQARPGHDRPFVWWLSLAQLITWGSVFYTFALLLEPVERELGLGRAQSSLGFSLALLAEGLLAYPVGRLIDRGHERAVMTCGSLAIAAGLALHSQVHGIAGFYTAWLLLGAALGALLSPLAAILPFVSPGLEKDANCAALLAEARQGPAAVAAPARSAARRGG